MFASHRKVALGADGARVYLSLEPPAPGFSSGFWGDIAERGQISRGTVMRTSEWIQGALRRSLPLRRRIVPLPAPSAMDHHRARAMRRGGDLPGPRSCISSGAGPRLRSWATGCTPAITPDSLLARRANFFLRPSEKIQTWLAASDRQVFSFAVTNRFRIPAGPPGSRWNGPIRSAIPSCRWGFRDALPFAGMRRYAGTPTWFLVLVPTLHSAYAITPFFPALPHRAAWAIPARRRAQPRAVDSISSSRIMSAFTRYRSPAPTSPPRSAPRSAAPAVRSAGGRHSSPRHHFLDRCRGGRREVSLHDRRCALYRCLGGTGGLSGLACQN